MNIGNSLFVFWLAKGPSGETYRPSLRQYLLLNSQSSLHMRISERGIGADRHLTYLLKGVASPWHHDVRD